MIQIDRTPLERQCFFRDRLLTLLRDHGIATGVNMSEYHRNRFNSLVHDVGLAFAAAEQRGRDNGVARERALSKLSKEDRRILGL
jgi:hypothetical protein